MKIIIPFRTRLSLAWFKLRAPKTKKEYSVVTPVSGNPVAWWEVFEGQTDFEHHCIIKRLSGRQFSLV
jgi:hypothetical protein